MAKKKGQDNQPKQEFHSTPFKALKGIAVAASAVKPEPVRPAPPPVPVTVDDDTVFLEAMEGVRRVGELAKKSSSAAQSRAAEKPAPAAKPAVPPEVDKEERAAFAQAIGQLKLDKTFTDEVPGDEELKPLGGNRLRQLKRGVVELDRQLDLHGLTREEALDALPYFMRSARNHGEKAVLIITGKGNNSPGEPVLQQAVSGWLRDAGREYVVEFAPAPRELGGSGAFVVFLRK